MVVPEVWHALKWPRKVKTLILPPIHLRAFDSDLDFVQPKIYISKFSCDNAVSGIIPQVFDLLKFYFIFKINITQRKRLGKQVGNVLKWN